MKKTLLINTDGGARGNPGPAAVGVFIRDKEGKELAKFGKRIGITTNNVAEYQAVILALEWVKENLLSQVEEIKFFLDSKLVVNQLNGLFKIKKGHLRDLAIRVKKLEQEVDGKISYHFISRKENFVADKLANFSLG